MNLSLFSNIFVCVCAFIGFFYGSFRFFKPNKALYAVMITLSVGCMAFGRLYQVVRVVTGGAIYSGFQLGFFGVTGSLLFLFSANYGMMDSLADDGSEKYRKYRLIPLAAPLAAAIIYIIFILATGLPVLAKLLGAFLTFFIMITSYYNLKHLIFPDVDYGIINCLKSYNLIALIYAFTCSVEMISVWYGTYKLTFVLDIILGVLLLLTVPVVERGIKKWTI